MFWLFPTNYVWNLSVNISMQMGAEIGEIARMANGLVEISKQGDDEGTLAFLTEWEKVADQLIAQADADKAKGRTLSAGTKLRRASNYLMIAERMQAASFGARGEKYRKMLDCFEAAMELGEEPCARVEIPYGDKLITGRLTLAPEADKSTPIVVHVNGLDSCKEMLYFLGSPVELRRRGISSLCIDQPGTGEALRFHGMKARYDAEHWASSIVDWLELQDFCDPKQIGCWGVSLGGYYCPRAVSGEPRFACGAVFGANHNWFEVQEQRRRNEGDRPVPHYWEHVRWVWGGKDIDEFMEIASNVHLNGRMEMIRVPFLVTHGADDRQIPLKYAHQAYEQLTNSPKRELVIFTEETGGATHAGCDNVTYGNSYIADWFAETFAEIRKGEFK
ncbi:prolyl oligopeptidase family serine peptidase [Bradyrhizobium sp. Leo121]|uniref:alpha/beta hydrolase family protein n=1 Tax=Bradyrhizobium sp. Leo121 TaxID=1571195 RepID=UPI001029B895|nr:prolyl oligopeptidase family serine peptidase [Bradyrhizobium sp. Leo121]RZN31444.1 alpha/beta hydrolase [Bradyrhizobium sp. Leo121]